MIEVNNGNEIKVAVLITGLNVVFADKDECWKEPMIMNTAPTKDGAVNIMLSPLCSFGNNEEILPISDSMLITVYKIGDRLAEAYKKKVLEIKAQRSGIQVAPAGVIPKVSDIRQHPVLRNINKRRK